MLKTNSGHSAALLLITLTLIAFGLGHSAFSTPLIAAAATLAIACYKGRLVILDFMELRHAPRLWRGLAEGWLLTVVVVLATVYFYSA